MFTYKGVGWKLYQGALVPETSPSFSIELNSEEEKELLKLSNAYFLRYVSQFDLLEESQFWYVIKDSEEHLENYKSKLRNQIRKGLKNCRVEKVDKSLICLHGYKIYIAAFESYNGNLTPMDRDAFEAYILKGSFDFWAVYNLEEKLIAYSQNSIEGDSVNYMTIKFHPDYLKHYPSYALFFQMNQYYLNENKFKYVNDGARSIAHETNIQNFLIDKFNFRKAYCRLHIVYRWDIRLLVWCLYPFKRVITSINHHLFKKLKVLLKQEEIRRSFER